MHSVCRNPWCVRTSLTIFFFFLLSWQHILLLPLVHRQAVLVSRSICVLYNFSLNLDFYFWRGDGIWIFEAIFFLLCTCDLNFKNSWWRMRHSSLHILFAVSIWAGCPLHCDTSVWVSFYLDSANTRVRGKGTRTLSCQPTVHTKHVSWTLGQSLLCRCSWQPGKWCPRALMLLPCGYNKIPGYFYEDIRFLQLTVLQADSARSGATHPCGPLWGSHGYITAWGNDIMVVVYVREITWQNRKPERDWRIGLTLCNSPHSWELSLPAWWHIH